MQKSLKIPHVAAWLDSKISGSLDKRYRHNLLKEDLKLRPNAIEALKIAVRDAHRDAMYSRRKPFKDDLDPLAEWDDDDYDPAVGYPEKLDLTTLKGYFGEFFAGFIAENFGPFDEQRWRVPAFSFREHNTAYDQLEMLRLTGDKKKAIVGRTGDDCLAFVLDGKQIIKVLFLEAKCSASYRQKTISDAHIKLSTTNKIPVEIARLIEILQDYRKLAEYAAEAETWITALRHLHRHLNDVERYDCVSYICGQFPVLKRGSKMSWIPSDVPHKDYTGGRWLEAVEIHLTEVDALVKEVYGKVD